MRHCYETLDLLRISAHGDMRIVPGQRLSAIPVNSLVVEVLPTLGGGYLQGENDRGEHVFYWPHLGLSFVEHSGPITSVEGH